MSYTGHVRRLNKIVWEGKNYLFHEWWQKDRFSSCELPLRSHRILSKVPLCMEYAISMTVCVFFLARHWTRDKCFIVLKIKCAIYLFYPIKIFWLTFNSKQGHILSEVHYLGNELHSIHSVMGPKKTSGDRLVQIKHLPPGALMAPPNCSPTSAQIIEFATNPKWPLW